MGIQPRVDMPSRDDDSDEPAEWEIEPDEEAGENCLEAADYRVCAVVVMRSAMADSGGWVRPWTFRRVVYDGFL